MTATTESTGEIQVADDNELLPLAEALRLEGINVTKVSAWRYTVTGLRGVLLKRWPVVGSSAFHTTRAEVRRFLAAAEAKASKKES